MSELDAIKPAPQRVPPAELIEDMENAAWALRASLNPINYDALAWNGIPKSEEERVLVKLCLAATANRNVRREAAMIDDCGMEAAEKSFNATARESFDRLKGLYPQLIESVEWTPKNDNPAG